MRIVRSVLLLVPVLLAGCGGGGDGGDEEEETVLALWPVSIDSFTSEIVETADVAFTFRVGIDDVGPVLATSVGDGDVGLFPRIDVANGGGEFLDVTQRLENGVDDEFAVLAIRRFQEGPGSSGRIQLESNALQGLVTVGPDLAGAIVTALQLELTVAEFEPSTTPLPEKQRTRNDTRIITGMDMRLEGTIRILGIPPTD